MNTKRKNSQQRAEWIAGGEAARSGALKRNNVYTTDAVRDWAGRIRCGSGGIKMNEKFLLEVMAASCNPRGVCELPVRYLADHIGVGMRQAQRIIQKLMHYELVASEEVVPQGRPNDVVRKFTLATTIDADTWNPKDGEDATASYATLRQAFRDRIKAALLDGKIGEKEYMELGTVHLVAIQSKRLDFVSPDAEVTNTVFKYQKFFLELASTFKTSPVLRLHMIPKKGYRG